MADELKDLVDNPRETMDIEIKSWLDLNDRFVKPKVARHLAALANNGGGYLVFGFNDDLTLDQNSPATLEQYSRDSFSSIVKYYLTPPFQCEVLKVENIQGNEIPIVRVPSHGDVPIVSKRDGPTDDTHKTPGIRSGTYYIRKPGPESAAIIGAGEWLPLIRRCVLNDRESLVRSFSDILNPNRHSIDQASGRLDSWHSQTKERFDTIASESKTEAWNIPVISNCYQLSYRVVVDDDEMLPVDSLRQILERVNLGVQEMIEYGWSMFYQFHETDMAPRFHPELADGSGGEVLEANLLGKMKNHLSVGLPDYWRVTPDGRATIVRLYLEDRPDFCTLRKTGPGTWISLHHLVVVVSEIVTHARLLSREFTSARTVQFRCTWNGLENRRLSDFNQLVAVSLYGGYIARTNTRTTSGEWSTSVLAAEWSKVVSELLSPVLRLFGYDSCNPAWIEQIVSNYQRR